MMRHVFRATRLGWKKITDGIWFDSECYTKEEAEAEFKPYQGVTQNGYSYTGYEYDGEKYHDYHYIGEYDEDEMPKNNDDYIDHLLGK